MKEILLPLFYLPPVSWFTKFLEEDCQIVLEQYENFPKQTYRNRANIYGANGRLSLIIPIRHKGHRTYKDIDMSYAEDWRKQHWKSIKNAYQTSAFFEYYEDRLKEIYDFEGSSLFDFNQRTLHVLLSILKVERAYSLNTKYVDQHDYDFRAYFSAKAAPPHYPPYFQGFSDRFGFLSDLSVLDLICNIGPESSTYIKNAIN